LTARLLPPSLDEWLPERHLARFIVEVRVGPFGDGKELSGSRSAGYHQLDEPKKPGPIAGIGLPPGSNSVKDPSRAQRGEASRLIQRVEPLEVHVTPIHDVEGAGLDQQEVQHNDVVHLAVGDVDEGGDRSPQIEQRVQLTAALVERNGAHGNIDRHRSMVVASRAYTVLASSTPKSSLT